MTSSNPAAELVLLVTGYRVSQAIHVAATLGIADIIKDGAALASDLAVATNSHAGALYRVLRALAAAGVFHEDDKKRFSLTPLGECLRSDAERPMAAWASFVGRPHQWQAWGSLSHSVRTGENAYRHVHGVGLWDYLVEHPEEAVIFDRAMTAGSRGVVEAIVSAYNFSAFGRVVDIGGGQGAMIAAVLAAHTNTHGILFDRPDVVARAQPVLEASGGCRQTVRRGGRQFLRDHSRGWRRIPAQLYPARLGRRRLARDPGSMPTGISSRRKAFDHRTDRRRSEWTALRRKPQI